MTMCPGLCANGVPYLCGCFSVTKLGHSMQQECICGLTRSCAGCWWLSRGYQHLAICRFYIHPCAESSPGRLLVHAVVPSAIRLSTQLAHVPFFTCWRTCGRAAGCTVGMGDCTACMAAVLGTGTCQLASKALAAAVAQTTHRAHESTSTLCLAIGNAAAAGCEECTISQSSHIIVIHVDHPNRLTESMHNVTAWQHALSAHYSRYHGRCQQQRCQTR